MRAVHVGFLLLSASRCARAGDQARRIAGWLLGVAGFAVGVYHWSSRPDLMQRAGELTTADMVVGVVIVVLVFEAARRMMGWALPIICGLFLLYGLFGQYLPGALAHRGFGFDQIVGSARLRHGGHLRHADLRVVHLHLPVHPVRRVPRAGRHDPLFTDFAMGLVGHTRGGPAKVAVISLGTHGHDQRFRRCQRRHRRASSRSR